MTDAIGVTKHWDGLGPLLDGPDKLVGSPGDDEVNVVVQLEQVIHLISAGHQADGVSTAKLTQSLPECLI